MVFPFVAQQLKQGLHREYVAINDNLNTVRGKINLSETIKNKIKHKNMMNCDFDEYSENNIYNQIIKTTAYYLIANGNVDNTYKKKLKKIMLYFNSVDIIEQLFNGKIYISIRAIKTIICLSTFVILYYTTYF